MGRADYERNSSLWHAKWSLTLHLFHNSFFLSLSLSLCLLFFSGALLSLLFPFCFDTTFIRLYVCSTHTHKNNVRKRVKSNDWNENAPGFFWCICCFFFQFFIICFDLFNLWLCDKLTNRVAFTTVAVSIQLVKASVASFPTGAMKTSSLTSSSNQLFIKLATLMIIK